MNHDVIYYIANVSAEVTIYKVCTCKTYPNAECDCDDIIMHVNPTYLKIRSLDKYLHERLPHHQDIHEIQRFFKKQKAKVHNAIEQMANHAFSSLRAQSVNYQLLRSYMYECRKLRINAFKKDKYKVSLATALSILSIYTNNTITQ